MADRRTAGRRAVGATDCRRHGRHLAGRPRTADRKPIAVSDDRLRAALQDGSVVCINSDARDTALPSAMPGMGLFALAGGALALRLPGTRRSS